MVDLRLRVNGSDYGGWTAARIVRGIESVAGSFELTVSDRWADQAVTWPIGEEDRAALVVNGDVLITGYVDTRDLAVGATDHSISFGGRDKTGDLVDCSALLSVWEFLDVPLLSIAKQVCKPFGIPVSLQPGLVLPKPVEKVTIDPGEGAFEVLDKACRMVGVLPVADGIGGLVLTRAGTARTTTALVEGKNIRSGSARYDATGRHRRYLVMAQHPGTDDWAGEGPATIRGQAQDPNVLRAERVLVVRPEGVATPDYANRRAQWEAKVRAGRAATVTITVQDWQQADGSLWPINALVPVRSPSLGINGDMLIAQATYSISDDEGTITQLALRRPDAFLPEPAVTQDGRWKELVGGA